MIRNHRFNPVKLYAIIFLGAGLRFYQLGEEGLWHDEAFSISDAANLTIDYARPLYYLFLHFWMKIFGTSEFITRVPSVMFGIISIILIYKVGHQLYNRQVGILSASILALSEFHIRHSRWVRMYSLVVLFTLASFLLFIKLTRDDAFKNRVGYIVFAVLLGYTHVFGLFGILAQNIYIFISTCIASSKQSTIKLKQWIGLQAITGVFLIPLFIAVLNQTGQTNGTGTPNWISFPSLAEVVITPILYLGITGITIINIFFLLLLGLVTLLGISRYEIYRNNQIWHLRLSAINRKLEIHPFSRKLEIPVLDETLETHLLVLWASVPVVALLVLTYLVSPIFVHRYTISALPGFIILISRGIQKVRYPPLRTLVTSTIFVIMVCSLLYSPGFLVNDQHAQWREAANDIEANANKGDVVVITDRHARDVFEYYFTKKDVLVEIISPESSPSRFQEAIQDHNTVWLIFSHEANNSQRRRILKNINQNYTKVDNKSYRGLTVYRFKRRCAAGNSESHIRVVRTIHNSR